MRHLSYSNVSQDQTGVNNNNTQTSMLVVEDRGLALAREDRANSAGQQLKKPRMVAVPERRLVEGEDDEDEMVRLPDIDEESHADRDLLGSFQGYAGPMINGKSPEVAGQERSENELAFNYQSSKQTREARASAYVVNVH